ncbi:hypothetical protein QUF72_21610 [Desulfobacterales bacterium HSG2]|nr:hypothetical protein [Desulfobacterales bacterium HSG2]
MPESKETLDVNVNVEITTETLQAIVANAKKIVGPNERGFYHIDTADKVSEMISRFLHENDFESYVKDIGNYPKK